MKISIIIPAYNEANSIGKTIEALLAQTYHDFEIIVVDNASTDDTSTIARQYPVRVVLEPSKGLLYARERGRREATGEIIAQVDADCLPASNWLEHAVRQFSNPKVVAVSGPYDYYDAKKLFRTTTLFFQKYIYGAMNKFLHLARRGAVLIGGNTLIRASALEAVGGYDTRIIFYGEDTDTAKRVSTQGIVLFDRDLVMPTSARRFHNEGALRVIGKYFFHFIKVTIGTRAAS